VNTGTNVSHTPERPPLQGTSEQGLEKGSFSHWAEGGKKTILGIGASGSESAKAE
jgi:hypothetical protein